MPSSQCATAVNRLLARLPENDLRRLLAGCETVELAFDDTLCMPMERLGYAYFPSTCFNSLVMAADRADSLDIGLNGNEGMFGVRLALGVDASPLGAVVRGAGAALRVEAAIFRRELARCGALKRAVNRYAFVQFDRMFGDSLAGSQDRRPPPEPNAMAGEREAAGLDAAIP